MSGQSPRVIPLDDAHEILGTFGIGPDNRSYQRWRRDDGIERHDLETILADSPHYLAVDWRSSLDELRDLICDQLEAVDVPVEFELHGEDGNKGTIHVGEQSLAVRYVASEEDDFDDVIRAINRLVAPRAAYRKLRSCEGTDGWAYVLATRETWRDLDAAAGAVTDMMFEPL
ncbi:hypothetical protein Mal4_55720 [Maioricimonas rarisocia]|uniref:Uncharacterized protein n=1 Tax=Maioricimonas rarisocia TaxID=2528026 RepID=A0A517ZFE3_9PLAN|nr:hypothetical protein [Maioricimonas rarisocia]QDU41207.1 hypothetical protein Mal4_55720 [Maioricimonas rarisocia]